MALNELISKPQQAVQYVPQVLQMALKDSNDQVSSLACKLLGVVVKEDSAGVVDVFSSLCSSLHGEQFDYAMLGLKICLNNLQQGVRTGQVVQLVVGSLLKAINSSELAAVSASSMLADALQVLAEVFQNPKYQQYIQVEDADQLVSQLQSKSVGTTKRASVAIAALASLLSQEAYAKLVKQLLRDDVASINTLSLLAVSSEFAPYATDAYQLAVQGTRQDDEDIDVDKLEASLQLIVCLVPWLSEQEQLYDMALQWSNYDPNRLSQSANEDEMDIDEDDLSDYSDDDDDSWKLRRVAAMLWCKLCEQGIVPQDAQVAQFVEQLVDTDAVLSQKLNALDALIKLKLCSKDPSRKRKSIDADMGTDQFSQSARHALLQLLKAYHKLSQTLRLQALGVAAKLVKFESLPFALHMDKVFHFLKFTTGDVKFIGEAAQLFSQQKAVNADVASLWPLVLSQLKAQDPLAVDALQFVYVQSQNVDYLVQAIEVGGPLVCRYIVGLQVANQAVRVKAVETLALSKSTQNLKLLLDADSQLLDQCTQILTSLYADVDRVVLVKVLQRCSQLEVPLVQWFEESLSDQTLLVELLLLKSPEMGTIMVKHFEVVFSASTDQQVYKNLGRYPQVYQELAQKTSQNDQVINNLAVTLASMNPQSALTLVDLNSSPSLGTALLANLAQQGLIVNETELLQLLDLDNEALQQNAAVALGYMARNKSSLLNDVMASKSNFKFLAALTFIPDTGENQSDIDQLWLMLLQQETKSKYTVDCLAKIAKLNVSKYSQQLLQAVKSASLVIKQLAFQTLAQLEVPLGPYYQNLSPQEDQKVNYAALSTILYYIQKQYNLQIRDVLPYLQQQTVLRSDLIETIEVGIHKHIIDHGLSARKLAYETLYAAMPVYASEIGPEILAGVVVGALKDTQAEIQSLGSLLLVRLTEMANQYPKFLKLFESDVKFMDQLLVALKPLVSPTIKSTAIKSDVEKANDLQEQACRSLLSVVRLLAVACKKNGKLELCPNQVKPTRQALFDYLKQLKETAPWKVLCDMTVTF